MRLKVIHDLQKLALPLSLVYFIGSWQANYAMIYPLKALIASILAYFLVLTGVIQRFSVLKATNNTNSNEQWKTGSRLIICGLAFYTLHPVAIALVLMMSFIFPFAPIPLIDPKSVKPYEARSWIVYATLIVIMDIIREYSVWKRLEVNPAPIVILVLVMVYSIVNVQSSRGAK